MGRGLKLFGLRIFFKYIVNPSGQLGYAGIVNMIGMLAILGLGFQWVWQRQGGLLDGRKKVLLICSAMSLMALLSIVLFYQGGIDDHPLNGRLYLPILVVLSLAPVYFLNTLLNDKNKLAIIVFILSLVVFVFYHPIAVEDKLTNNLMIIREYRYVDDFLKKHADKNMLVICGRPGQLIVSNVGAVSYKTANNEIDSILTQLKNHLFSKIYVIQQITYSNLAPYEDNVIDHRYQLNSVDELQETGAYFLRISQVMN